MSRRTAREAVFKALFQSDITGEDPGQVIIQENIQEALSQEEDRRFAANLATGIGDMISRLDPVLVPFLKKWTLKRLPVADRAILRLALYEILYVPEIPPAVSINEALELAKKYGDAKSPPFINGVLDGILRTRVKEAKE